MDIKRSGSQPSTKGSTEYFTGAVRIDSLFQANDPARAVGASVTFEQASGGLCIDVQKIQWSIWKQFVEIQQLVDIPCGYPVLIKCFS
jgi:hypothetical protein